MHVENPPLWDGLGDVRIPTPDLNWQEEACVLAGSVPANAAGCGGAVVPLRSAHKKALSGTQNTLKMAQKHSSEAF